MKLKKINLNKLNKRGQFETKLLAIITIFIIGIILLFFNRLNNELYDGFDKYFNDSEDYNQSKAHIAIQDIRDVENSVWDYAFLAIFIGFIIQIVMFSFATRISMAFYWIMLLLDIPILIIGVVLSNIWQEIALQGQFVETIARFPITNSLLGTYYPIGITMIIFITSIIVFGKRPGDNQ